MLQLFSFSEPFGTSSNTVMCFTQKGSKTKTLKGLSQPLPFSMTSKLLIKHGEANSYCFTVPKVCLIILNSFTVIFLRFDRLRITYNRQILACKQKQRCG